MKKQLLFLSLVISTLTFAQVGVNTAAPSVTLEVIGKPSDVTAVDGFKAPTITIKQLEAKHGKYTTAHTGTFIYVTDVVDKIVPTINSTQLVVGPGYYYFDGILWQPIPRAGSAILTAKTGVGNGAVNAVTVAQNGFNVVKLETVTKNLGGGAWDSSTSIYTVPVSGTYFIKSSVRLVDGSDSRNLFQAVDTEQKDIPQGLWVRNPQGGGRFTMLYNRLAYFNKNDQLRLFIYSDGAPANISDASLDIVLMSQN